MKKINCLLLVFILLILLNAGAEAEFSSNLHLIRELNPGNNKIARETYVDDQGNPVVASDKGYAAVIYTYNKANLLIEIRFTDAEGKTVNCADHYATVQYAYQQTNIIRTAYLDAAGESAMGPEGYAVQEIHRGSRGLELEALEYDPAGNLLKRRVTEYVDIKKYNRIRSISWINAKNELLPGPEGYARVAYEYRGQRKSRITYYAAEGGLFYYAREGYAEREEKYRDDKIRELNYYGADGNLIAGPDGYAQAKFSYTRGGKETLTMYYNADGSLFFTDKGYCGIQQLVENSHITDEKYYAGEGIRGTCSEGYSRITRQYTMRGEIGLQCYYDEKDYLICPPGIGYAKIRNTYNYKYLVRTEYFDAKEKPVYGPDGYAAAVHAYTDKLKTETVFYDTDGKTVINGNGGYAKIRYQYNQNEQCISEAYFGADGKPVAVNGDATEIRWDWKDGRKISESYWKDEHAVNGEKGYHEIRTEYTESNKIKKQSFYDEQGNLKIIEDGYAAIEKRYDGKNREMATLYYNDAGELMPAPGEEYAYMLIIPAQDRNVLKATEERTKENGTESFPEGVGDGAEGKTTREDRENSTSAESVYIEYYGTDGKLMNLSSGYAYLFRQTDAQGRIIREAYFDKDGQGAIREGEYDEIRRVYGNSGEPNRIEYYLKGKPVLRGAGYAAVERKYDQVGNIIEERYFDTEFKPTRCNDGYEMIRKEYNDRKQISHEAYFVYEGFPMTNNRGVYQTDYEYNEQGQVSREAYFDRSGEPMTDHKGVYQTAYEYNEDGLVTRELYYDGEGIPMNCPDGYAGLGRIYDNQGGITAQMYYDTSGEMMLIPGKEYAYAITWEEKNDETESSGDSYGAVTTICVEYYGTDGELINLSSGYASIVRKTDQQGRTVGVAYYDQNRNKGLQNGEYDEIRLKYGDYDVPSRIEYYLNDAPVLRSGGYAAVEREYDEAGNVIEERYFDAAFEPVSCKDGYEAIRRKYNGKQQVIYEAYYDHSGQPMTNNKGLFQIAYEYDGKGNISREAYFDGDGQPMMNSTGVYQTSYEYNENGQKTREQYYNGEGRPMCCPGGYAGIRVSYTSQGEVMATRYYNENGKMILTPGREYAYEIIIPQETEETAAGNSAVRTFRVEYHGTDGELINLSYGYASILRKTDDQGRNIEEVFFDKDGQKEILNGGYDEIRQTYTEGDQPSRIEYYLNGTPVTRNDGYAAVERKYNSAGNIIEERYFDLELRPVACTDGYEMVRKGYNEEKRISRDAYYYHDGEPAANRRGVYQTVYAYNEQGQTVREAYFDREGNPMPDSKDVYRTAYEYNEDGQVIRETYYDNEGRPARCADGYAGLGRIYGRYGRTTATLYYDETGELIKAPGKEYAYEMVIPAEEAASTIPFSDPLSLQAGSSPSQKGSLSNAENIVYVEYFGTDGQPMNLSYGYAVIIRKTDDEGRTVGEAYFDKDGQKVLLESEYDEIRLAYEDSRNPSRIEYYADGEPVLRRDGYAAVEREYNETGDIVEERYFGTDFEPVSCRGGYEMIRREYNEAKQISRESFFDHDGQPTVNENGVYETAYVYDENGLVTRETYFDGEGNPMTCPDGYAGAEKVYGSNGEIQATMYCDMSGGLMLAPGKEYAYEMTVRAEEVDQGDGSASMISFSDPLSLQAGSSPSRKGSLSDTEGTAYVAYYGIDRELMNLSAGYAAILRQTDGQGRIVREEYFDTDGERAVLSDGYDEIRQTYTEGNNPVRIEYYRNGCPFLRAEGYAAMEYEYDEVGNVIEERYFDTGFWPTACSDGYEMIRKQYNREKRVSHEAYFNSEGQPTVNRKGVYQTAYVYNENGLVIRETWFDASGQPMSDGSGHVGIEYTYNAEGNIIREAKIPPKVI